MVACPVPLLEHHYDPFPPVHDPLLRKEMYRRGSEGPVQDSVREVVELRGEAEEPPSPRPVKKESGDFRLRDDAAKEPASGPGPTDPATPPSPPPRVLGLAGRLRRPDAPAEGRARRSRVRPRARGGERRPRKGSGYGYPPPTRTDPRAGTPSRLEPPLGRGSGQVGSTSPNEGAELVQELEHSGPPGRKLHGDSD